MTQAALVVHSQSDEESIPKDDYIQALRSSGIDEIFFFSNFTELTHKVSKIENESFLLLNNASDIIFDYRFFLSHCHSNQVTCLLTYSRNNGEALYYFEEKRIVHQKKEPAIHYDAHKNASIYHISKEKLLTIKTEQQLLPNWGVPCPISEIAPLRPALFLDRDGVLIEDGNYLFRPEDVKIYPEIIEIIKEANRRKWFVFVLTNQSGIARGYFNEKDVVHLHNYLDGRLQEHGAYINHWEFCPFYHKSEGEYARHSLLRKPNSGMLLKACHRHPVDLNNSFMIGDKKSDILNQPGVRNLLIQRSYDLEGADAPIFYDLSTLKNYLFA